jgi:YD repeat-containing protein
MNLQITAVIDPADRRQRMKYTAWQRPGAIRQFQFPE